MGQREMPATNMSWAVLLVAVAIGVGGGCWEEIEYQGPPSAQAARRASPPIAEEQPAVEQPVESPLAADVATSSAEAEAANFGEDLAESLPEPAAPIDDNESSLEPTADVEPEAAAAPVPEEDRYSMPPAETSANYASIDSNGQTAKLPPADDTLTAAAVDESAPVELDGKPTNTELAAWQLGGKLSLAALANDRGVAAESVQNWLADCRSLAATLGTATADLPEPAAADDGQAASRAVLNYLLSQGQRIGRDLARRHGGRHPALFEVAMKSNLLRVLYEPDSLATAKLSAAIADAAKRAELPAESWQPLSDALAAKADLAELRKAVQRMHADVERHLAEQVER